MAAEDGHQFIVMEDCSCRQPLLNVEREAQTDHSLFFPFFYPLHKIIIA